MKRTLLILGGVALICMLLVVRLFRKQHNNFIDEREWFAKALRYEFSAQVDSVRMLNENTARLWCHVTAGDPKTEREDSLKTLFKEHDMLYFIFHHSADSIVFLHPNGKQIVKGDSLHVSSERNSVEFFRDDAQVTRDELSDVLTGFGRPFFLKRK